MNEDFKTLYFDILKEVKEKYEVEKEIESNLQDYSDGLTDGRKEVLTEILLTMYEKYTFYDEV